MAGRRRPALHLAGQFVEAEQVGDVGDAGVRRDVGQLVGAGLRRAAACDTSSSPRIALVYAVLRVGDVRICFCFARSAVVSSRVRIVTPAAVADRDGLQHVAEVVDLQRQACVDARVGELAGR